MSSEKTPSAAPVDGNGYAAIPVSVARSIGQDYRKDCVVILAYDHATSRTHATTWGREPSDKAGAVHVRDKCLEAIGGVMTPGTVYQDYRREGERAKVVDALARSCRELVQAMRDYEMDVDIDQPRKHREMMKRAQAAIEAA